MDYLFGDKVSCSDDGLGTSHPREVSGFSHNSRPTMYIHEAALMKREALQIGEGNEKAKNRLVKVGASIKITGKFLTKTNFSS